MIHSVLINSVQIDNNYTSDISSNIIVNEKLIELLLEPEARFPACLGVWLSTDTATEIAIAIYS